MSFTLLDFECPKCGVTEKLVERGTSIVVCCGVTAHKVLSFPRVVGDNTKSFNPHYDLQLGQHFNTAEEKKSFLKKTGRIQESGPLSPRNSRYKSNILCTRSQAVKGDLIAHRSPRPNETK